MKGSLELTSDTKDSKGNKTGEGMKEYKKNVSARKRNTTATLEKLLRDHSEALGTKGVKSVDELAAFPEFAEDEEITSHHKAEGDDKALSQADTAFITTLMGLGVEIDEHNFSYETAENAIVQKLKSLEEEIIKERIQTPEGKAEAIQSLAVSFESRTPQTELVAQGKENSPGDLVFNGVDFRYANICLSSKNVYFAYAKFPNLLPVDFKKDEALYGSEIVTEALRLTYNSKIDRAVTGFDEKHEQLRTKQSKLEGISPKNFTEAQNLYRSFQSAQDEFRRTAEKKSTELAEKNIAFNPTYAIGYGDSFEKYISIVEDPEDVRNIEYALKDQTFPP